jgi:hypothetical protein
VSAPRPPLNEHEEAVLALTAEDAFALWEVASEVGDDKVLAAEVVKRLLRQGLVELGYEDWSTDPPGHIVNNEYVGIPFTGDADATLADPVVWREDGDRKVVVSTTSVGVAWFTAEEG